MLWWLPIVIQTSTRNLLKEKSLLSWKHVCSSPDVPTGWFEGSSLWIPASGSRCQNKVFGCLWTWVPQKHQTKFWDLQKKSSREEQLLHPTSFGVCLCWSIWGSFCIFIMAHSVFSLRHEVENYAIVVHKQGSFLTSSCPINNAEQVSMERSREFRVRHYPVSPSFYGQVGRRPHWGSDLLKDVFVL